MTENLQELEGEARLFGHYLLARPIDDASVQLYARAMQARLKTSQAPDQALLQFARTHPHLLGLLDAGAALLRPNDELRRRLFVLFSILETRPAYAELFLPKRHSLLQTLLVAWRGLVVVGKVLAGAILVKAVAR